MKQIIIFLIPMLAFQAVKGRKGNCGIAIAIDEPYIKNHFKGQENLEDQSVIKALKSIVENMVKKLNDIYNQVDEVPIFFIQEVWLFKDFIPNSLDRDAVLNELTKYGTSQFCIVHLLTYRDFQDGLQGYAYNSICKHGNTGFTTALNNQKNTPKDFVKLAFAHEVGHNLGALHDGQKKKDGRPENNCKKSGFLMGASIENETDKLSKCSKDQIRMNLQKMRPRYKDCLAQQPIENYSICGDLKVEGNEECDCGVSFTDCNDPCCYASTISPEDLSLNKSATPCRTHQAPRCIKPYLNPLLFSIAYPFLFIVSAVLILAVALTIDWKTKKIFFTHVTETNVRIETAVNA